MKYIFSLLIPLLLQQATAQPGTEVYLFDLDQSSGKFNLSNPKNLSQNPGFYDNQPSFINDDEVMFVSTRDGQTDVKKYSISNDSFSWLTATEGSEYSPTKIPDEEAFSCILLKPDGEQLLWKYSFANKDPEIIIPELKVGYHTWLNASRLMVFVLESGKNSLYLSNLENKSLEFVADSIGRSFKTTPNKERITYLDKSDPEEWKILEYTIPRKKTELLAISPQGKEDLIWIGKKLVIGVDSTLQYWSKDDKKWVILADLKEFNLGGITRIAINNSQNKLAIVANE